jgi:hypothetical protein
MVNLSLAIIDYFSFVRILEWTNWSTNGCSGNFSPAIPIYFRFSEKQSGKQVNQQDYEKGNKVLGTFKTIGVSLWSMI